MAKINTTNYQPVAAWNGTQDLFVVEQPDGTKVATPEQVKQYVEAGDFEATGEVKDGHGNILAKKADITTVTIPAFTPSEAGWRRICKIKQTSGNSAGGMIYVGGSWSNRQPASASIAVNIMQSKASLTLLSSANNDALMTSMRLVYASGNEYWLDIYFPSYSNVHGPNRLTFTGDIAVSNIQDPISITTDSTAATAEVPLNQNVSGTVLTDRNSILSAVSSSALAVGDTFQIPSAMLDRKIIIICINRAAWAGSVTVTTAQIKGGDCAMGLKIVSGDINNPTIDKYIVMDISATGLITVRYIKSWSAPYVKVNAL